MQGRVAGLVGALVIVAGLGCGVASAGEEKAGGVPDFSGRWRLDKAHSDDEAAKLAAAAGKDEKRKDDAAAKDEKKKDDPQGVQRQLDLTDEITIAQNEVAIAVTDKAGQMRAFYPNGKTYKADDGASEMTSAWKAGALVFEKKAARGWKRHEAWQLTPDGRLRVEIRIEGGGRPKVTLAQVYDRVRDGQ